MGRTVDACATLFAAMLALPAVPQWTYRDLSRTKFARLRGYFEEPLEAEVRAALNGALAALQRDGAQCISARIEGIESAAAIQFAKLFDEANFLICPTMRAPVPPVGASQVEIEGRMYPLHTAVIQLTMPFNLSGLPAISVPWASTSEGVPIGLQIVGRPGADWQVLAAAQRLEALCPASPNR